MLKERSKTTDEAAGLRVRALEYVGRSPHWVTSAELAGVLNVDVAAVEQIMFQAACRSGRAGAPIVETADDGNAYRITNSASPNSNGALVSVADWTRVGRENEVARKIEHTRWKLCQTLSGNVRATYIAGPPGIGKSNAVMDAVEDWFEMGLEPIECRPENRNQLLDFMELANGRQPLVMEEWDLAFRSKPVIELLKKATDRAGSGVERRLRKEEGETFEVPVRLDVPLVITTNQDPFDDRDWDSKLIPDRDALFNRDTPVVFPRDRLVLWEWTVYTALTTQVIRNIPIERGKRVLTLTLDEQARALDWLTTNLWRVRDVGLRTLQDAACWLSQHERGEMSALNLQQELGGRLLAEAEDKPTPVQPNWRALLRETPKSQSRSALERRLARYKRDEGRRRRAEKLSRELARLS